MKAVVVGAGIAGLVTARQLGLAGWDIELLEKSAAPRPDMEPARTRAQGAGSGTARSACS